jgi:hypothetical protein
MMFDQYSELFYGPAGRFPSLIFAVLIIWSIFWKGISLWKSSRNNQKYWYVALLILNTLGIADLIYLAFFQKKRK